MPLSSARPTSPPRSRKWRTATRISRSRPPTAIVSSISSPKGSTARSGSDTLQDSNLVAKRIGPIYGTLVASPDYIKAHGSPETPDEIVTHEALMQGTETWQFLDGDRIVTVQPQGRFKADSAVALAAASAAGLGIARLPDCIMHEHVASGALVPIMTRYPPPPAGAYVVRPPGQHPARKIRVLTETLIEHFARNPGLGPRPGPEGPKALDRLMPAIAFRFPRHSLMRPRLAARATRAILDLGRAIAHPLGQPGCVEIRHSHRQARRRPRA
jgi:hypothetical protein